MPDLWYDNAVFYAIDVDVFQDSDGDGIGDFRGLIQRLDYLADLGVTCLWLLPFFPSPGRDNGYDVANYLAVDPRVGTLDDFEELLHRAGERGIRVVIDLAMNHTSDQHPWFQASRRDARSRFRDYYVWTESPPPVTEEMGTIFPGVENTVWTYDPVARAYFHHRFYSFEPSLNAANPEVREEIRRVIDFWLSFPISGMRVDAASHMIESKGVPGTELEDPHTLLRELRSVVGARRRDAVLIGEADVVPAQLATYFGEGDELNLLFNFLLDNYLFLALARGEAEPVLDVLKQLPAVPEEGQWANFLRNLDELDLERLPPEAREEVYRAFAPEEGMRIYNRGIRRRLAPMLRNERSWIELAFSLLFSLPGVPVLVYGDEIGMGEDLSLPERNAVRTPMQWSAERNAGFSTAEPEALERPVVARGEFGYRRVNVAAQREDPGSLLNWMRRLIRVRLQCPELGSGHWFPLPVEHPAVFANRCAWKGGEVITVHNLGREPCTVVLDLRGHGIGRLVELMGEGACERTEDGRFQVELRGHGYRWLRVAERAGEL